MALTSIEARRPFLEALAAIADGATLHSSEAHDATVTAVFADPQCRLAVFNGREGLLRSLGSVYACSVCLFLGGLRGVVVRRIVTRGRRCIGGIAVSPDASTLFTANDSDHAMRAYNIADGMLLCATPGKDYATKPLQFLFPRQLGIDADGMVVVADSGHDCIHIVTPRFDTQRFIGQGLLMNPIGVCCDEELVAAIGSQHVLSVFQRRDGKRLRLIDLHRAMGLNGNTLHVSLGQMCFWTRRRDIAFLSRFIGVFVVSLEGTLPRRIGDDVLCDPQGLACSALDELLVADRKQKQIFFFNPAGELLRALRCDVEFGCIALRGTALFAADNDSSVVEIR